MASLITEIEHVLAQLKSIAIAFIPITTIAVGLRLYTRGRYLKKIGVDDWLMLLAWALCIALIIVIMFLVGQIQNIFTGHGFNVALISKLLKADLGLYIISMTLVKLSLCFFFLNIFSIKKLQRYIIYGIATEATVYGIIYVFFTFLTCGPTTAIIPGASCKQWIYFSHISTSWSWINAATDMMLAGLSIWGLWNANMNLRVKISALLVLLLGTVGGIASIIRVAIITNDTASNAVDGLRAANWTIIELGISITAASLACLRPLLRAFGDKWHHSTGHSHTTGGAVTVGPLSGTFGGQGYSGMKSALTHEPVALRDWRDDRVKPDEEICVPQAAIISSAMMMELDPEGTRSTDALDDVSRKSTDRATVGEKDSRRKSMRSFRSSRQDLSRLSVAREWMKF